MQNGLIQNALSTIAKEWQNEGLTLEMVAAEAGFSLSYFDRLFARSVGKGVMEYIRTYRLIRAASMLRAGNRSILDIALDVGYANPENFARAFGSAYGMPPSEYRGRCRGQGLKGKDLSTGAVIRMFEAECPDLRRIDTDEATDALLLKGPLLHCPECFLLTQIDGAVYTPDKGESENFIAVYEFQPDIVALEIMCKPEMIKECLAVARRFPRVRAGITFAPDEDANGIDAQMRGFTRQEYENYVYPQDDISVFSNEGYTVRLLDASDVGQARKLIPYAQFPLETVLTQKFELGLHALVDFLGLFRNDKLVGLATPSFESVRGFVMSDLGDFVLSDNRLLEPLWAAAVKHALSHGARPVHLGVTAENKETGAKAAKKMGYVLMSKKLVFSNGMERT